MGLEKLGFWFGMVDLFCWAICFWWMYRISARQDEMLTQIGEQTRRIEELSKTEHDLIKEVHPQVGEIRENVQAVAEAVITET